MICPNCEKEVPVVDAIAEARQEGRIEMADEAMMIEQHSFDKGRRAAIDECLSIAKEWSDGSKCVKFIIGKLEQLKERWDDE